MNNTTLSAITALLITTTGLSASTSISLDTNETVATQSAQKDIRVVPVAKVEKPKVQTVQNTKPQTPAVVVNVNTNGQQQVAVTTIKPQPKPIVKVNKYDDTIEYAKAVKNNYAVGEEIKIKLSLKRDAYIYFWTISADGKGYLILPNNLEAFNKYKKKTAYVVPERSADYQFVSDRVGVEEVFVLATSKPISKNEILKIFSDKTSNIVPTAPKVKIEIFMTKDIQVIAKKEKFQYDVESFQIGVREAVKPKPTNTVTPVKVETTGTHVNITVNH